jgi:hypothetical protein
MNASGPYDFLGKIMLRAHGSVKEVRLLEKPKDFILVFGDGTELEPRRESKRKDWYLGHRELLLEYVNAGYGGGDPLHVLAFGYSGTGSHNLATLLRSSGFSDTTVITSEQDSDRFPVILKPDGRLFTIAGDLIDVEVERQRREAEAQQRRDEAEKRRAEEAKRRAEEQKQQQEADAKRNAEEERKRQVMRERKDLKLCVMCSQPLGVLDKLRGRDRHHNCVAFHE